MDLTNKNIEEYFEMVKEDYDIDYNHFKIICGSPFRMLKNVVSQGLMKNVRLQYLGVFEVSAGRVKYQKRILEDKLNNGLIGVKKYEEKMKTLNRYEA
jgi:hypothetical protein